MLLAAVLAVACSNEARLFCSGKKDEALEQCLSDHASNLRLECFSALHAPPPSEPAQDDLTFSAEAADDGADGFELKIEEAPESYDVSGRTPAELAAATGRSGIADGVDGTSGAASTGGQLSSKYSRRMQDGGCRLTGASLALKVTQRLPRWEAPPDAAPETAAWWRKASAVIKLHEDGHKKIDVAAARAALSYLRALGASPTCDELDAVVASELHRANVEGMQKNVAYDARTEHGRTQFAAAFGEP